MSSSASASAFSSFPMSSSSSSLSPSSSSASTWWKDTSLRTIALQECIPPLSADSYKGSSGRIGVLGGSLRFTGAPYYTAMASLKVGADLAYCFCAEEASIAIKCYSPELMVTSVYCGKDVDTVVLQDPSLETETAQQLVNDMVQNVTSMMKTLHVLVIGPGLGRCPLVMKAVAKIIQHAQSDYHLPLVLDADALFLLTQPNYQHLLTNESVVVLTPNVVERKRLQDSNVVLPSSCIVLEKGAIDKIEPCEETQQYGWQALVCHEEGGWKRSGGIGDILAGTTGTLVAWNRILTQQETSSVQTLPVACWTACCFVKQATKRAFDNHRRSMTAPDVLDSLGPTIDEMTREDRDCERPEIR